MKMNYEHYEEDKAKSKEMKDPNYTQLCVWQATLVGEENISDFEKFMYDKFNGVKVKYEAEVKTKPDQINGVDVPETGDRNDLFFYVHDEDINKFAVPRLAYGIKWWEDVLSNGGRVLYPKEFLKAHPKSW